MRSLSIILSIKHMFHVPESYTKLPGLLCCIFLTTNTYADASKHRVDKFAELEAYVLAGHAPSNTLLVMDNDDTLTMMPCPDSSEPTQCQYLGGPAWFAWQNDLLDGPSHYRVAKNQNELLAISALLFAISNMSYTEENVPGLLQRLASRGVRLLVEAARGSTEVSATERQYNQLQTPGDTPLTFLELISNNSLVMGAGNSTSLPGPFIPCGIPGTRPVSYQQGIMYLAGQNKGVILQCLLQYYELRVKLNPGLPVKHIVFIDDDEKNVEDVFQAFKHSVAYKVQVLHYTALQRHKRALTEGQHKDSFQKKTKQRWLAIKTVIAQSLISPATLTEPQ